MNETARAIRRAWWRIRKPECWTKYASARDGMGCEVDYRDTAAVAWCAGGAIFAQGGPRETKERAYRCLRRLVQQTRDRRYHELCEYNDEDATTHRDIRRLFAHAYVQARTTTKGQVS